MITGEQIAARRKELKLSRQEFAQRCGLTAAKLWRIETKNEFKSNEMDAIQQQFFFIGQSEPEPNDVVDLAEVSITQGGVGFPEATKASIIQSGGWCAPSDVIIDTFTPIIDVFTPVANELTKIGENIGNVLKQIKPTSLFDYDTTRYVSHSEITTFQDCPRKWYLAWHNGLKPIVENPVGALAMGTRVHKVLELYYTKNPTYSVDPRDSLENLIMKDWTLLLNTYTVKGEMIPPEVKKKFETEARMQRVMIEGFIEWEATTGENAYYKTIEPESFIQVDAGTWHDDRKLKLVGRVDRLVKRLTDGAVLFEDFKTAASIPALVKILPINTQMKHYLMLLEMESEETNKDAMPIGALYTILRKSMQTQTATPPFYARVEVYHNKHERTNYRTKVDSLVRQIEVVEQQLMVGEATHHEVAPPRPSNDCSWKCPFFQICPMMDDGSNVQSMVDNHFTSGRPLDYYDPSKKETD